MPAPLPDVPAEVLGRLDVVPALDRLDLLAPPVADAVTALRDRRVLVAEIDPELADTAALCEAYATTPSASANCVVVTGKRAGDERWAACLVLATTRADVNGLVKRRLDVRKASFAPREEAIARTSMEFGGITPLGLPAGWPLLVDAAVAASPWLLIGSGVRRSKLLVPGDVLAGLPAAEVVDGLGV
ncbi:MAG: YbaK/EbsC family protein [Kineosporiaceae bacterium]